MLRDSKRRVYIYAAPYFLSIYQTPPFFSPPVIYYNDPSSMIGRAEVLEEWEDLLLQHTDLLHSQIQRSRFILHFSLDGIPFDVAASRNLADSRGEEDVEERQMKADMEIARKSADPIETGVKTLTLSAQVNFASMSSQLLNYCL